MQCEYKSLFLKELRLLVCMMISVGVMGGGGRIHAHAGWWSLGGGELPRNDSETLGQLFKGTNIHIYSPLKLHSLYIAA